MNKCTVYNYSCSMFTNLCSHRWMSSWNWVSSRTRRVKLNSTLMLSFNGFREDDCAFGPPRKAKWHISVFHMKYYFASVILKPIHNTHQYGLAWASLVHSHAHGDGVGAEQIVQVRLHLQPWQDRGVGVQGYGLVEQLSLGLEQMLQFGHHRLVQDHLLEAMVATHLGLVSAHTLQGERIGVTSILYTVECIRYKQLAIHFKAW